LPVLGRLGDQGQPGQPSQEGVDGDLYANDKSIIEVSWLVLRQLRDKSDLESII
jgi:hypothetical protein